MSEKQPESSWDKLLGDLGAEPEKAAFERHQPEPTEIPPELDWEAADAAAEAALPAAGDWNTLADTLGLEGEAPAAAEEKSSEPVAKKPIKANIEAKVEKPKQEKKAKQDSGPAPFGGFLAPEASAVEEVEEDEDDSVEEAWGEEAEFEEVGEEVAEEIVAEVEESDDFEDDFEDDFDDDDDDDDDDDEVSSLDEELPPLPNASDQALIDTTWEEDEPETNSKKEAAASDGSGISGEAARSAFDALFSDGSSSWGSAFLEKPSQTEETEEVADEDSKSELTESVDAKTGADSEGEGEEGDRPKRKRSRRRRRGGRGRKSSSERTEGEVDNEATNDEQVSDDLGEDSSEAGSSDLSEDVDGEEKKKSRRRRPRRRRSSKSGDEKSKVTSDASSDDEENEDDDLLAAASGDEESDADDSENPRGEGRGRQRHRNLPTWAEAIGVIVDTNLESRAKSPNKPQSSRGGRGGRGRSGRGGGGRGRSGRSGSDSNTSKSADS